MTLPVYHACVISTTAIAIFLDTSVTTCPAKLMYNMTEVNAGCLGPSSPGDWLPGPSTIFLCHHKLIAIAFLAKLPGSVEAGNLPTAFGWTIITTDLTWWPVFASICAMWCVGLKALLRGD
jgi:hypothetical protein